MPAYTQRKILVAYLTTNGLFTLASSLIWAVNTIFLLQRGGLTIFQVMLVNTAFTVGEFIFQVPTGVIADTIGRRASYLLAIGTLVVSTLLYVAVPIFGWGLLGFVLASLLLGLGFTFQIGAVDAWMVDALDHAGWEGSKNRVFAWGQMAFGTATLVGSLLGGFLGQVDLVWPYLLRAAALAAAFALVTALVHDSGFKPRALHVSNFREETRRVFSAGVKLGWGSPVLRPLLFTSLLTGIFGIYSFYSWQPYVLELLGKNYVWLLGIVQAVFSLAMIGGNLLVRVVGSRIANPAGATRVLAFNSAAGMVIAASIGLVAVVTHARGVGPALVAIGLWLLWGVLFGLSGPLRAGFVNEHIPSAERATMLSIDSLFGDVGGSVGQPALGYLSGRFGISAGWLVGALFVGAAAPFYVRAGRAAGADPAGESPVSSDTRR
ncbi:MAG: MFS transporter [Coriobacteriia bacterium]|nr:MFS transporter [Coriobacteriia bacterium]